MTTSTKRRPAVTNKKKEGMSLEELFAKLDDMGVTAPEPQPAPKEEPKPPLIAEEVSSLDGARFTGHAEAVRFMTAGKAVVTLRSRKTGARFTYRIAASDDGKAHFVGVLSGPDNTSDYQYLGRIARDVFYHGRKNRRPGDIAVDAPSNKAFDWAWRSLVEKGVLPEMLEIWHEGTCGRCGRKLTVPESIASGLGPECAGRV